MQDTVYCDNLCVEDECVDIHLCACPDTHLFIEDEPFNLLLDEMEQAYQYELWQCLQKLTEMDGKLTPIYNSLETITQAEVHAMWSDEVFRLNISKLNVNKLS